MTTIPIQQCNSPGPSLRAPLLFLSQPPNDPGGFAHYRADIAGVMKAFNPTGVILVSVHWPEGDFASNPILHIGGGRRGVDDAAVILAERAASRLSAFGVSADLEAGGMRRWPGAMAAFDGAHPLLHVSVPANFGPDLMVLTGHALEPLRDEGIVLAGCGDRFDRTAVSGLASLGLERARTWALNASPGRLRDVYSLLFLLGAASEDEGLVEIHSRPGSRVIGLAPVTPGMGRRTSLIAEMEGASR